MPKIKVACYWCGTEIERWPCQIKRVDHCFCSHECTNKWKSISLKGANSHFWRGGKQIFICDWCGNEFFLFPSRIKQFKLHFCSKECNQEWLSGKNNRFNSLVGILSVGTSLYAEFTSNLPKTLYFCTKAVYNCRCKVDWT